jgi:hypothetical protein
VGTVNVPAEHEHWFFAHEDPRWLICDCGQYAVRTRNITGDRVIRLIDPPKPVFPRARVTDLSECPQKGASQVDLDEQEMAV